MSFSVHQNPNQGADPASTEIIRYAEFLGIDLKRDSDLIWTADHVLRATLPPKWQLCSKCCEDEIVHYCFNSETLESQWDHPCDEHYRQIYILEKERKAEAAETLENHSNKTDSFET